MNNYQELPDNFEELIRHHSWDDLPMKDKLILEKEGLNQKEYESIRAILNKIDTIGIEQFDVDSQVKKNLLNAFDQPKPKVIPMFRKYLAIAASVALLFGLAGLFYLFLPAKEISVVQELEKSQVPLTGQSQIELTDTHTSKEYDSAEQSSTQPIKSTNIQRNDVFEEESEDVAGAAYSQPQNNKQFEYAAEESNTKMLMDNKTEQAATPQATLMESQFPVEADYDRRMGNFHISRDEKTVTLQAKDIVSNEKKSSPNRKTIDHQGLLSYTVTIY